MMNGWMRKFEALPIAVWAFIGLLVALVPAGFVQVLLEREVRHERTDQLGQQAMRFVRLVGQQQQAVIEAAQQMLSVMAAHASSRPIRATSRPPCLTGGATRSALGKRPPAR
jgi:hypothetical protein